MDRGFPISLPRNQGGFVKRLAVVLLLCCASLTLAVAGPAAAQMNRLETLKNTTPAERATAQTAMMKKKLGLSAEQGPKVEAINLKYAEKMQPVLEDSSGPLMKMRAMESINQEKEGELKTVLSPAQFQKYLAGKEEMREKIEQKLMEKASGGGAQ
jgi:hypothetical protein